MVNLLLRLDSLATANAVNSISEGKMEKEEEGELEEVQVCGSGIVEDEGEEGEAGTHFFCRFERTYLGIL